MNQPPTVTISIEIELGWGRYYKDYPNYREILSKGRQIETSTLQSLLELCDEVKIPITFDVVGHLFLNHCNGKHTGPYKSEWFSSDPGSNVGTNPLFYAPDLVEMIDNSRVNHEIATHTFSHVLFDQIDDETADHEFQLVKEVHKDFELPNPVSLVAPLHKKPPLGVLQKHGIETIRSAFRDDRNERWPIQSINVIQRSNVIRKPEIRDGVLHSYSTPYPSLTSAMLPTGRRPVDHPLSWIPIGIRKQLHEKKMMGSLQKVIEKQSHLHLWTHLFNMANKPQFDVIRNFLQILEYYEEETALEIKPMNCLKSHYL
jgi:peptidoglycan/xylan/chitin deacetylase (PgdA/CDA1 family)